MVREVRVGSVQMDGPEEFTSPSSTMVSHDLGSEYLRGGTTELMHTIGVVSYLSPSWGQ